MTPHGPARSDEDAESSPLNDPARWAELVESVNPRLMQALIANAMSDSLRAHCTAADIWQETLVQAWKARGTHRFQGKEAFRSWLSKIAENTIRDTVRRIEAEKRGGGKADKRIAQGTGSSDSSSAVHPPDSATPSGNMIEAEFEAAKADALARLPPDLKPVLRKHLLEGMPMEQVAAELGISVSSAWRRYRKGFELYKRALGPWAKEDEGG